MRNYLLPPLTGKFRPVMVSVGQSPIRRCRLAVQTYPSNDCCGHDQVDLKILAQDASVFAGPFEAHGSIETLRGLIVLSYAQPDFP